MLETPATQQRPGRLGIARRLGTLQQRLPGIGGRLADKVIAELCGKMARFALSKGEHPLTSVGKEEADLLTEAVEVLLQLQYSKALADEMVQKALAANPKIKTSNALISAIFNQEAGE